MQDVEKAHENLVRVPVPVADPVKVDIILIRVTIDEDNMVISVHRFLDDVAIIAIYLKQKIKVI